MKLTGGRNEALEEAIARTYSHVRLGYAAGIPALLLATLCDPELTGHHWGRINNINYCEIIGGRMAEPIPSLHAMILLLIVKYHIRGNGKGNNK